MLAYPSTQSYSIKKAAVQKVLEISQKIYLCDILFFSKLKKNPKEIITVVKSIILLDTNTPYHDSIMARKKRKLLEIHRTEF